MSNLFKQKIELMSSAELTHVTRTDTFLEQFRVRCGTEMYRRDQADFRRRNKHNKSGPRRTEYYGGDK